MRLGIDSSQYTSVYGAAVTFTVTVTGGMNPTGTFKFTDGSATIAGCGAVALVNGSATCATAALTRGKHQIRGWYSGDSNNGVGVAGPITQRVN
jgi:hypothetical protein